MTETVDTDKPTRAVTYPCRVKGCNLSTREAKPYCPEHVEKNAYVQDILRRLDEVEVAERKAVRGEGVSANDSLARQILCHLAYRGALTPERIAREILIPVEAIRNYGKALVAANKAKWSVGLRTTHLELTCDPLA